MEGLIPSRYGTRSWPSRLLPVLLTVWTTACMTWSGAKPPTPQEFSPGKQIQVWAGERSWRLHGVRVTPDTVSGIHFMDPLECDSCRISLPLAAVDSIKTGRSEAASIAIVVVPVGLFLLIATAIASSIPST